MNWKKCYAILVEGVGVFVEGEVLDPAHHKYVYTYITDKFSNAAIDSVLVLFPLSAGLVRIRLSITLSTPGGSGATMVDIEHSGNYTIIGESDYAYRDSTTDTSSSDGARRLVLRDFGYL